MDVLGLLRRLPEIVAYNKFDDDFLDRLNYSHTVAILTVFAIIATNRQFSENQIKCWVPAQFTGGYEQYVNQICFIKNTYSFDMHESLPESDEVRHEHELKYYQWTPFILLLMAILFYIPHQFWRALSLRSGVDLKDLVEAAQTYRSANVRHEDKMKLLEYLTNWLNGYCSNAYRLTTNRTARSLTSSRAKLVRMGHYVFFPVGLYTGNYLIISYLFVKFLYLFNSVGQILLLNTLLGRRFWFYGIEIIYRYWTKQIGLLYTGSEYFPKVVLCDFSIREPNHPKESHRYTVQCVLPFNLFNQQIFTYLYFWLLILSCFNLMSIFIWLYRMSPYNNFHYLERRLVLHFLTDEHEQDRDVRRQFVYRYLKGDGTFMLRLIAANVSDYVCTKIILELYDVFRSSLTRHTIGRESLFKLVTTTTTKSDHDTDQERTSMENDDDQRTVKSVIEDIPPVPNPRQGKLSVDRDFLPTSPSDLEQMEPRSAGFYPGATNEHVQMHTSMLPLMKDTRRASDSSERTTSRYRNMELQVDSDTMQLEVSERPQALSCPPSPPPTTKGPSPYATTYLSSTKKNEHEVPYVDESIASSSASGRATSVPVARRSDKSATTTTLAQTDVFFRRSHDV